MRRLVLLLAAALLILAVTPVGVSAAESRCSIEVTPSSGGPTDLYRVTVSGVPVHPEGGSVEVRIDAHRLGTREGSVFFVLLVPGTTEFYVDLNKFHPEEPVEPMTPGRYLVQAETPHLPGGCHAVARFVVA